MLNYFKDWKCRASYLSRIAVSLDRLTESQKIELDELEQREADALVGKQKPLPPGMKKTMDKLRKQRDSSDLPRGVKTFLREEWVRAIHGRDKQIESKYLKKGISMEENALDLVSNLENKFYKKNTEQLSNDYIKGTPDSIDWIMMDSSVGLKAAQAVDDTKCAWDIFTYYAAVDNSDDDGKDEYEYQIQGYCAITGAEIGRVRRCLLDTPQPLLDAEMLRLKLKLGVLDGDGPGDDSKAYREGCAEIEANGKYETGPKAIPAAARLHTTVIKRDDELLAKLYVRIIECRAYLSQIHQEYLLKLNEQEIEALYLKMAA